MSAPRQAKYSILLLATLLLCSCGGKSSMPQQATSSLRIVSANASEASINVLVDGMPVANNVTFLKNTGYLSVPAGQHSVALQGWNNPPNENFTATFPENGKSTLLFDGWGLFSGPNLIPDDMTAASTGNFKLRLVNTTAGLSLDAFVLPAGTPPGGTPTFSPFDSSENSPSQYLNLPAGSYHVVFTNFQGLNVQFDTGPITFSAGQNRTLLLINNCMVTTCSFNAYTSMVLADLN